MRSKHTDEQLAWLRGHLPKYEQKTSGATRGDAKKFALDCAHAYIQLWGLPKNANGEVEKESVVKEQIYTWFKNSCARGKDARLKHQQKKALAHSVQTVGMPGYPPPPGMMMPGGVAGKSLAFRSDLLDFLMTRVRFAQSILQRTRLHTMPRTPHSRTTVTTRPHSPHTTITRTTTMTGAG
ncbi:hypothetical protein BKA62DRAFT_510236 [Auriculariales sp. MPI-PUGE-AT-0066]|nr:hypothetical protein BKA62DRAFT_510236 [Auriculariales sp. MPI-PUGE-AT-0066]